MFFGKYKQEIEQLKAEIVKLNIVIDDYKSINSKLEHDLKNLNDIEFKYRVTKSLLDDDESVLEILNSSLMFAAKKDVKAGLDIRDPDSFFYKLVNKQANEVLMKFNKGGI